MTRAVLLGEIMQNYQTPIAISGTHGKTTTTSMLSEILLAMDTDPTLSIGGILKDIGGNIRIGSSELFVAEACEYTNSFLSFFPKISAILNIDADHLDFSRICRISAILSVNLRVCSPLTEHLLSTVRLRMFPRSPMIFPAM